MKVYAISDIHGRYDLFEMLKQTLQADDICYVIGDCADRGPDGWKIIKEVYEDPRFIYLKGNHEDMLVEAMKDYLRYPEDEKEPFFDYSHSYRLCRHNGGGSTFRDWVHEKWNRNSWVQKLDKLPLKLIYINKKGQKVILTHAGYTPHLNQKLTNEDYLWDRYHFNCKWDEDFIDTIIVHGHTPVPYMDEYMFRMYGDVDLDCNVKPGAFWYSKDSCGRKHKVNIDSGAFFTGCLTLIDLDTWEQHLLMAEDCIYED